MARRAPCSRYLPLRLHMRQIDLCRVASTVRCVWPLVVVFADITGDSEPQRSRRLELVDINALALQAAKPTLDEHVIHPARLPVHALTNPLCRKAANIIFARKLTALIGIDDARNAVGLYRRFDRLKHRRGVQRVAERPADDEAAEPVDNRREIHVFSAHFDVRNVDRPDLIGHENVLVFQQVRELFELLAAL